MMRTSFLRAFAAAFAMLTAVTAPIAVAGDREQAQRIHDRITGVPPSPIALDTMTSLMATDPTGVQAALYATNDPRFYSVTLKNFAAPWTNRDQSAFVPLNDYMTLVIGMVRDNIPFDRLLYGDILYIAPGVSPGPSASNNDHFAALETRMRSPSFDPSELQQTTQSAIYGLPPAATAGAMTTRAAAEAFFVAGTNRAMFRFTLVNHMCMDMEQVQDTTLPPDRIRQDVSRSPGGDSRVFLNNCIGCHSGMDPLAQAFAYYNFDPVSGRLEYTDGFVQPKYFNNDETFADGFITPDDSWSNYWREGQNAVIGWATGLPGEGSGAKSMGQELAASNAFASCQVRKTFKAMCLREPVDAADHSRIDAMTLSFKGGFNLRQVFAESAAYCKGD